jgi:hypothetical protein
MVVRKEVVPWQRTSHSLAMMCVLILQLYSVAATQSPVLFVGTGERMEDLQPFDAASFIKRLLGHVVLDKHGLDEMRLRLDNVEACPMLEFKKHIQALVENPTMLQQCASDFL